MRSTDTIRAGVRASAIAPVDFEKGLIAPVDIREKVEISRKKFRKYG